MKIEKRLVYYTILTKKIKEKYFPNDFLHDILIGHPIIVVDEQFSNKLHKLNIFIGTTSHEPYNRSADHTAIDTAFRTDKGIQAYNPVRYQTTFNEQQYNCAVNDFNKIMLSEKQKKTVQTFEMAMLDTKIDIYETVNPTLANHMTNKEIIESEYAIIGINMKKPLSKEFIQLLHAKSSPTNTGTNEEYTERLNFYSNYMKENRILINNSEKSKTLGNILDNKFDALKEKNKENPPSLSLLSSNISLTNINIKKNENQLTSFFVNLQKSQEIAEKNIVKRFFIPENNKNSDII